ncbi:MAG TPA: hypothetical protein ENI86_18430, partial [Acidimicrobiales bacterium]|nr:hypothetical protein [Acidimicrobiales bacterium]
RDDCSGLAEVLSGWDGRYTLDVRSRITRHVSSCEVCERTRRAVVRPEAFLGALPLTAAPALLRDRTIGAMAEAVGTSPPTSEGTASPESPVESPGTPQFSEMTVAPTSGIARLAGTRWFTATAVTALILLFTGATIMVVVFYKGPPGPPAGDQPVATTSSAADQDQASAPSSTPVVATDSPAAESPTTAPSTTGAPTTAAPTTAAPTTAAPTTAAPATTAAVPTTTTAPTTGEPNPGPQFVRLMARPTSVVAAEGSCPGESTEVVALVDDPDGVSTVVVRWSNGVDELTTPLDPAGSSHVGIVGPFGFPGPTVLTVIATDTLGAVATAELSLDVSPCP